MEQTFEKYFIEEQERTKDLSPMKVSTTHLMDLCFIKAIKDIRRTLPQKIIQHTNIFFSFLFVYIYLYIYIFLFFFGLYVIIIININVINVNIFINNYYVYRVYI